VTSEFGDGVKKAKVEHRRVEETLEGRIQKTCDLCSD